jgi:hypothetical protein
MKLLRVLCWLGWHRWRHRRNDRLRICIRCRKLEA